MKHFLKSPESRLVVICVLCLLSIPLWEGCTNKENGPTPSKGFETSLKMIYLNSVEAAESPLRSQKVRLRIRGSLPSPAYSFQEFKVQVSGRTVDITPLASYAAKKTVIQVLVPFDEVCTIETLTPGDYEVRVHGRGEDKPLVTRIAVME